MNYRIKELCKERGITLSDLADKVEMKSANLSASLSDKGNPTMSTLSKIADALNVNIVELFEGYTKPKKKDAYFGSTEIKKEKNRRDVFCIGDFAGDSEIQISDAEILGNENSPEVILLKMIYLDKEHDVLLHKKDLLPLSVFLLNIYNEYNDRLNSIEWNDFTEKYGGFKSNYIEHNGIIYKINSVADIERLVREIKG